MRVLKRLFIRGPDREFLKPRLWSNKELRRVAPLFEGHIINVSGWKDRDREGGFYKDYFSSSASYTISNWFGSHGFQGKEGEILLDLEADLPEELKRKYDVVFNHTTLEHIFDVFQVFQNLCELSKDIVIITVPFLQRLHYREGFSDYWRFTPYALRKLFERNGLHCIYEAACNMPNHSVYVFSIGSRFPEKWSEKITFQPQDWLKLGIGNVRNDIVQVFSEKVYSLFSHFFDSSVKKD